MAHAEDDAPSPNEDRSDDLSKGNESTDRSEAIERTQTVRDSHRLKGWDLKGLVWGSNPNIYRWKSPTVQRFGSIGDRALDGPVERSVSRRGEPWYHDVWFQDPLLVRLPQGCLREPPPTLSMEKPVPDVWFLPHAITIPSGTVSWMR